MRARFEGEKRRLNEDSQHARFILARSFKYEETQRTDLTSSDGSMSPPDESVDVTALSDDALDEIIDAQSDDDDA